MPVTIRKCVAFVWLCYHIKYILLTKTLRNCHGCLLVFFLPLDLFFLPLQEARSAGASVVSPVDIQKVNTFTFFCLALLSIDFFSVVFALSLLLFLVKKKRSPSINNWGDLGCAPFKVLKLFYKPNCLNAGGLTAVMTCSSVFLL